MINLGDLVQDRISGFEGMVVAINTFLHGCRQIAVRPLTLDEGLPMEVDFWFDEPQLKVVQEGLYQSRGGVIDGAAVGGPVRVKHSGRVRTR